MPPSHVRLAHLRAYLLALGNDVSSAGKFRGQGPNKIEAAAAAALSGGSAMAAQMAADLKTLGGEGLALARPMVEGFAAQMAEGAARDVVGRVATAVGAMFGERNAQRNANRRG